MVFLVRPLLLEFKNLKIIDFEESGGGLLFDSVQLNLGNCTDKNYWVH